MTKFIIRLLGFLLPLVCLAVAPLLVLIGSRENFTDREAVLSPTIQRVGYAYNQPNYRYLKWARLQNGPPYTVVALGSSRVLQFRSGEFTHSFYNAGFSISSLTDFEPFLRAIPLRKLPEYLIIGLDQWMFNDNWDDFSGRKSIRSWGKSFSYFPSNETIKGVYGDLLTGKYHLLDYWRGGRENTVGLAGHVQGSGIRPDGSMDYGSLIERLISGDSTTSDYRFQNTYGRITRGDQRFEYGARLNVAALPVVRSLLAYCAAQEIHVVAFIPPLADEVHERMVSSGKHTYLAEIIPNLLPLFDEHDFELHNFMTLSLAGSDDTEAIDGFHGGERTYLKLLLRMLDHGSRLRKITDRGLLEQQLVAAPNTIEVYQQ